MLRARRAADPARRRHRARGRGGPDRRRRRPQPRAPPRPSARCEGELWRAQVEAGITTADVARLARENGLLYPPDPGAAEQSQIGGNIATNAGGPHTFKYGVTGAWVTGLEVVLAPGELIPIGGPVRKDVAGYDIKSLLIGSEGTLGVVTAAWLRLTPAPESQLPVVAFYASADAGCEALGAVLALGPRAGRARVSRRGRGRARVGARFRTPFRRARGVHADRRGRRVGRRGAAAARRADRRARRARRCRCTRRPSGARSRAVALASRRLDRGHRQRGGKVSEDIVVPVERLARGDRRDPRDRSAPRLPACSWGHAGDGNLHSTFMIDRADPDQLARAEQAAPELFALACELGGSVSGEHGARAGQARRARAQWPEPALALHESIKRLFDPKGLLNPGKKLAR